MSDNDYKPVLYSDRVEQHRCITVEQVRKLLANPESVEVLLKAGWNIQELRRMADIADKPKQRSTE